MTAPKCRPADYIDFLIASPKAFSCTEAARAARFARSAGSRRLHPAAAPARTRPRDPAAGVAADGRPPRRRAGARRPDPRQALRQEEGSRRGIKKRDLVARHRSGKHKRVVNGVNLVTPPWPDGDRTVPCDDRLYDKADDGLAKNDHFRATLAAARERGFAPECVPFDGWCAGLDNLKALRTIGWRRLTRLKADRKANRKVDRKADLDRRGLRAVGDTPIAEGGTAVRLEGYGLVRVFRIVSRDGDIEHWATDDLARDELARLKLAERS